MKKKRTAKKIISILFILMILLSTVSCVSSPQVEYDNFITDLDILYRLEEVAFNVEFGRYSDIWQREIQSVITDLETCTVTDAEAVRINNMFIKSAEAFLKASQLFLVGSNDARFEGYDQKKYATSKFREAVGAYNTYITSTGD